MYPLAINSAMGYGRFMYTEEEAKKLKQQYALALLKTPNDTYAAARTIEAHPGKASWITINWTYDEEVLAIQGQAQKEFGPSAVLPSQDEFAVILLKDAQSIKDDETRLKYYKLFADVRGYITKEGSNVTNNNLTVNKVMAYPITGNVDAWEKHAIAQQDNLLKQANVIEHVANNS